MKRRMMKALALILMLCMLLPQTALAATTYYLDVSITGPDANGVSQTWSAESNSKLNARSTALAADVVAIINEELENLEAKFDETDLGAIVIAGVEAFGNGDWATYVDTYYDDVTGNFKDILKNKASTFAELQVNEGNKISYMNGTDKYEVTVTLKEYVPSGGGSGSGGSGGGGGTAAPVDPDPMAGAPGSQIFIDVPADHAFGNEIEWAYNEGLLKGVTENTYEPGDSISRQQLWMTLGRLAGVDPADMAAAKAWAVELGISDGTIPGAAVTRQQMVTIIYRYAQMKGYDTSAKADISAFPDADKVSDYAADAMEWAVANGIVNGTLAGTLNPAGNTTRGQFAAILYRFANKFV